MIKTIGNPMSWAAHGLTAVGGHVTQSIRSIGGEQTAVPEVRRLEFNDIRLALQKGYEDFSAVRSDVMFICLIYPIIGALLIVLASNANLMHLAFPLIGGFALIGPFSAVGLYEVSRRRERGETVSWLSALDVIRSPQFAAVLVLGFYLAVLLVAWLVSAHLLWGATMGDRTITGFSDLFAAVFTSGAGWTLAAVGTGLGACFALVSLVTGAISFPLLVDRNIGVPAAVVTSVRVFQRNPIVILVWGLVVAALLVLGALPVFTGLIVVLPTLGHATWHLYRRAVVL